MVPELPEVETIRRGLLSRVMGRSITEVSVKQTRILQLDPNQLVRQMSGQTIRGIDRRGKFLIFELDRHYCIFHLGMTGQLTVRDPSREDSKQFFRHPITGLERAHQHAPDRHTHLQLLLDNGTWILLRDIRKFGKVFLIRKESQVFSDFFRRLGLEPFTSDYNLEAFVRRFRNRRLRVKSLLLDQGFVAGLGNIYADEALHEAGIHPGRLIKSLLSLEKERLFQAIPCVLQRGITHGGTSLRDYVNSEGESGTHQEQLQVYGRNGKRCYQCGSTIKKIVISQRGTHFCPTCQPVKRNALDRWESEVQDQNLNEAEDPDDHK